MIKSFKHHYLPYILAYTIRGVLWLLMRTCRFEIQGLKRFITTAEQHPCILMLWHNSMAVVPAVLHRHTPNFIYTAIISKSRDGNALAALTTSFKQGRVIRIPHNSRAQALNTIVNRLKNENEILMITPDGPRGPFKEVKPGIVFAAYHSQAKIVPFVWHPSRSWILKTKDKMVIPKPFSKIKVSFGEPISINECNIETETQRLKEVMLTLGRSVKF